MIMNGFLLLNRSFQIKLIIKYLQSMNNKCRFAQEIQQQAKEDCQ